MLYSKIYVVIKKYVCLSFWSNIIKQKMTAMSNGTNYIFPTCMRWSLRKFTVWFFSGVVRKFNFDFSEISARDVASTLAPLVEVRSRNTAQFIRLSGIISPKHGSWLLITQHSSALFSQKLQKQNVFDDFQCAAKYLVEKSYSSADKIVINGKLQGYMLPVHQDSSTR